MNADYPLMQIPVWIEVVMICAGALAGAAGAVRQRFDLVGVLFVAIVMGLGGGIIRDVLLDLRPVAVTKQGYVAAALAAGLLAMALLSLVTRWSRLFYVFDALALGLFVIVGAEKAVLHGAPFTGALLIGVTAGVGGGVLRDVVSGLPVEIVRRGTWNAAAAIVGALLYLALRATPLPSVVSDLAGFATIVGVRYCSLHFGWQTSEAGALWAKVVRRPPPATRADG